MFTFYWAKYIKIPVCIYNYFKCIRLYKISKTWIQLKVGCWSITLANGGCQQIRIHGISKILHWWLKLTDHTHVFIGTDRSTWNQYGTDCGQNSGNIYGNVANIRWEYLHQGTMMGLQGAYYGLITCILYDTHCKKLPFNKSFVRWTEAIPSQFHGTHPKPRRSRNPGSRHLGPTSPTWAMAWHHGPRFLGWLGVWQWKC